MNVGDYILLAGALAGAIASIFGLVVKISKPLKDLKTQFEWECKRNQRQDDQIVESLEQRRLLMASVMAILEGQIEQGCNNNATKAHGAIHNYLNDRPFNTDWYEKGD